MASSKQELRKIIKARKAKLTASERNRLSHALCKALLEDERVRRSRSILLFHALADEPDTSEILAALAAEKEIYLPIVVGNDLQLGRYTSEGSIAGVGAFGIKEPKSCEDPAIGKFVTGVDLAIVPGVAFDAEGHRLGRGRGYYDRLLSQTRFASTFKLGYCFPFQLVDNVAAEPHDVKMDAVFRIS